MCRYQNQESVQSFWGATIRLPLSRSMCSRGRSAHAKETRGHRERPGQLFPSVRGRQRVERGQEGRWAMGHFSLCVDIRALRGSRAEAGGLGEHGVSGDIRGPARGVSRERDKYVLEERAGQGSTEP